MEPKSIYNITACGNGNQTGEGSIQHIETSGLPYFTQGKDHGNNGCNGGSDGCGNKDGTKLFNGGSQQHR